MTLVFIYQRGDDFGEKYIQKEVIIKCTQKMCLFMIKFCIAWILVVFAINAMDVRLNKEKEVGAAHVLMMELNLKNNG